MSQNDRLKVKAKKFSQGCIEKIVHNIPGILHNSREPLERCGVHNFVWSAQIICSISMAFLRFTNRTTTINWNTCQHLRLTSISIGGLNIGLVNCAYFLVTDRIITNFVFIAVSDCFRSPFFGVVGVIVIMWVCENVGKSKVNHCLYLYN